MDYRYVIKVELTEYLDRVNVGCDRKKNEGCLNVLDLNNWSMELLATEMKKAEVLFYFLNDKYK